MWKENVVSWHLSCSIFIVPLNKHTGLDEVVSILHGALWESVAGGPLTIGASNQGVSSHQHPSPPLQWD